LTELARNFPLVFLRHRVYIAHPVWRRNNFYSQLTMSPVAYRPTNCRCTN